MIPNFNDLRLSVREALEAVEAAQEMIRGAEDQEELDQLSDYNTCMECLPEGFTQAQKGLAQQLLVQAYMRSIGRC